MALKLHFQLTEKAAIEAVTRMGGFQGSETQRRATVQAHRASSAFRMKCAVGSLPRIIGDYTSKGYELVKAEEHQGRVS